VGEEEHVEEDEEHEEDVVGLSVLHGEDLVVRVGVVGGADVGDRYH